MGLLDRFLLLLDLSGKLSGNLLDLDGEQLSNLFVEALIVVVELRL